MSLTPVRLALRADVTDGFRAQLDTFLGKVADGFIVAHETADGENPHIHAIISTHKTLKAVRSEFVRCCPSHKGNKMYSLKACDDDFQAYIRYICKGASRDSPPTIWTRLGLDYTDEVIGAAHLAYYVNQAAVVENAKKRKKVESANIVEQLESACKALNLPAHDRKGIAMQYLQLYKDARKGINVFAARACVNTVSLLLDRNEHAHTELATRIAEL